MTRSHFVKIYRFTSLLVYKHVCYDANDLSFIFDLLLFTHGFQLKAIRIGNMYTISPGTIMYFILETEMHVWIFAFFCFTCTVFVMKGHGALFEILRQCKKGEVLTVNSRCRKLSNALCFHLLLFNICLTLQKA